MSAADRLEYGEERDRDQPPRHYPDNCREPVSERVVIYFKEIAEQRVTTNEADYRIAGQKEELFDPEPDIGDCEPAIEVHVSHKPESALHRRLLLTKY